MVVLAEHDIDLELGTVDAKATESFGERLANIRKSRGLTQTHLGEALGITKRNVAYFETDGGEPPGPILPMMAKVLDVSIDELLGVKPIRKTDSPKVARLMNRLRRVQDLSPSDQRAVLKYIDSLYRDQQASTKPKRKKSAS